MLELPAILLLTGVEPLLQDRHLLGVFVKGLALRPRTLQLLTDGLELAFEPDDAVVSGFDGLAQRLLDLTEGLLSGLLRGQVRRFLGAHLRLAVSDDPFEPGAFERVLARHTLEGVERVA